MQKFYNFLKEGNNEERFKKSEFYFEDLRIVKINLYFLIFQLSDRKFLKNPLQ